MGSNKSPSEYPVSILKQILMYSFPQLIHRIPRFLYFNQNLIFGPNTTVEEGLWIGLAEAGRDLGGGRRSGNMNSYGQLVEFAMEAIMQKP